MTLNLLFSLANNVSALPCPLSSIAAIALHHLVFRRSQRLFEPLPFFANGETMDPAFRL